MVTVAQRQSAKRVVHIVRSYGGLTEPFIAQRVTAKTEGFESELWFERATSPPDGARQIRTLLRPGTMGDRAYHRLPALAHVAQRSYREMERLWGPAIVHAHYATTGYLAGLAVSAPLVVSAYGFDVSALARHVLWRRAYAALGRRARYTLVEGPVMRRRVIELGFPPERVVIVTIAAGLNGVQFMGPRPRDPTQVRLLTCGRLVEKKGHDLAIAAFAALRSELPPRSVLDVAGSGPLLPRLRELAASLGIADNVRFLGSLSRSSFRAHLAETDLFLAPSVTAPSGDAEGGAPTTILDAQSVGTVVVGSTHDDIPFLISDGETGYLSEEGSVEDLVSSIRRALGERDRWSAVAEAARGEMYEKHSDEAVTRQLAAIYAAAIA